MTPSEHQGFTIRAQQYGFTEAARMQDEDEDFCESLLDLIDRDPEDRRPKSRRPVS
jgi:hypothetical protein